MTFVYTWICYQSEVYLAAVIDKYMMSCSILTNYLVYTFKVILSVRKPSYCMNMSPEFISYREI